MFRTVPVSITRSFHVHTAIVCHIGLLTVCEQDQDGTPLSFIRNLSLYTQQWHMSYTIVVGTVKNS